MSPPSRAPVISELRRRLKQAATTRRSALPNSGGALASLLPEQRFQAGSLVEWVSDQSGSHLLPVALASVLDVIEQRRSLVLIDTPCSLFAPALAGMGFPLSQLLLVRPHTFQEALWAAEQALRCPAVAVVLCRNLAIPPAQHSTIFRRFQLAAEAGQTLGFFLRTADASSPALWTDLRLHVAPLPTRGPAGLRRVRVRVQAGRSQGSLMTSGSRHEVCLCIDEFTGCITHETPRLHLASPMADSTLPPQQSRA